MFFVIGGLIVAGVAGYQLGLFDRPIFRYYDKLVTSSSNDDQSYLIAILAFSTEKKIGLRICKMMNGIHDGILESIENAPTMMTNARKLYTGSETEEGSLGISLYFDNPLQVDNPRWAAGFAIQSESFDEIQTFVSAVQKNSGLKEVVRAVRIGKDCNILKASIPYHHSMTPALAPMIQWKRAYEAYSKGGYKSFNGRPDDADPSPAMEVYYTGARFTNTNAMDYIVLMGDTTQTYDDCYPSDISNVSTTN